MTINNGSNLGLHAGILMHQGKMLEFGSHLDATHIAMMEAPKQHTHLGTIDMWAYKRKADVPFLSIAGIGSNNVVYTESDWLTYDVATASDSSLCIVEDISGAGDGKGGTEFEILVNSGGYGHGQVFKFDEMLKEEIMVTDTPIRVIETGAGMKHVVYTVKRIDSTEPLDKLFLQPGTKLVPMHTEISREFGQSFASFGVKTGKANKYIVPVGQVTQQVHYSVTTKVAEYGSGNKGLITISGDDKAAMDKAFEYYFKMDSKVAGIGDNGINTLDQAIKSPAIAKEIGEAFKGGKVQVAISTLYDSLALKFLARGEQSYQLWGTGGVRNQGGMDEYWASVGAWQQLDTGYKFVASLNNFSLDVLKAAIYQYFYGKMDLPAAGSEPVFDVQTGMGGMQLANKLITDQVTAQALQIKITDFGQVSGNVQNLSYKPMFYKEVTIPMVAHLRFIYNPAFDPIDTNELTNPTLPGGFKLSSYSMIFHDVNTLAGQNNIKILRSQESGGKVHMTVINGQGSHPLTQQIGPGGVQMHQGTSLKTGYAAYFTKQMDSLHVVDPTRVLKIVFASPVTNKTF
jgi:hypothetical protein